MQGVQGATQCPCPGMWQAGAQLPTGRTTGFPPLGASLGRRSRGELAAPQELVAGPGEQDLAPCSPRTLEHVARQQAAPLPRAEGPGDTGWLAVPRAALRWESGSAGSPASAAKCFALQQGLSTSFLRALHPRVLTAPPGQRNIHLSKAHHRSGGCCPYITGISTAYSSCLCTSHTRSVTAQQLRTGREGSYQMEAATGEDFR